MQVMPLSSNYEVGGSSTAAVEGHSLTLLAPGVPVPPSVIKDLCTRMGNLEFGHGLLMKKVITVSDAEVFDAIRKIHLRAWEPKDETILVNPSHVYGYLFAFLVEIKKPIPILKRDLPGVARFQGGWNPKHIDGREDDFLPRNGNVVVYSGEHSWIVEDLELRHKRTPELRTIKLTIIHANMHSSKQSPLGRNVSPDPNHKVHHIVMDRNVILDPKTLDHNLWDIIVDGDLQEEAAPAGEQSSPPAPKTAKQLTAKRNQERVKSILLLAIPNEYLLKFHNVPDAKSLWAAIKSRVYEDEMKRSSSSISNSQNLAFLSSENTSSTNEVSTASGNFRVNTAGGTNSSSQVSSTPGADEVVCSFFAQQTTSPPLDNEDLQQIDQDDLEELDIRWQVAMLTVRVQRFIKKTGRNLDFKGKQPVTFDNS
ncbi:hypothetical protein Tco_0661725 [Tanacetum coccineum]